MANIAETHTKADILNALLAVQLCPNEAWTITHIPTGTVYRFNAINGVTSEKYRTYDGEIRTRHITESATLKRREARLAHALKVVKASKVSLWT